MSGAISREEFLEWLALLDAALDQPQPTPALVRAIHAVTKPPSADKPRGRPRRHSKPRRNRTSEKAVMRTLMRGK